MSILIQHSVSNDSNSAKLASIFLLLSLHNVENSRSVGKSRKEVLLEIDFKFNFLSKPISKLSNTLNKAGILKLNYSSRSARFKMQQAVTSTLEELNNSTIPSITNNFNLFISNSYFDVASQSTWNNASKLIESSTFINRTSNLAAAIQQSNTTITTTSSHFVTFLVLLPWGVKYSNSPEVQVVLASIPMLIIGFAGVMISGFQASIGRMSR